MRRVLPPLVIALVLAGCGGDDEGFTAQQFVNAMNERGAALELGPELRSTRPDAQVFELEVAEPEAEPDAEEDDDVLADAHAGGSLAVMPDDAAGLAEWERCEQAVSLLCFQADNIVLLLEGEIPPPQYAALAAALEAIKDETGG